MGRASTMKIYLMGRGHRLEQIRDALGLSRLSAQLIDHERDIIKFGAPAWPIFPEDLIIVTDFEEATLRVTLDNLARQELPAKVMVFTPVPSRNMLRDYPDFLFRDESLIYKNELRELQRKAAGLHKVESIQNLVRGFPFLCVVWGNPDPDAIASSYALMELVQGFAPEATIAYMGEFTRPENSAIVNVLKIPMRKFTWDLLKSGTVVATVEAQPSFFKADDRLKFGIIVDHHPLGDLGEPKFSDVRPTYGSTSTIFTEYYQAAGIRMSKKIATALFYGLKVDTGNLTRNVSEADVAAFRYLRMRTDENMVRTIELSQLPVETLDYFAIAIANKKIRREVAFAYLGNIPNP